MDLAYAWYEAARAMMGPARLAADMTRHSLEYPGNPFAYSPYARSTAAALQMFERATRRYGKPHFGIATTSVDGQRCRCSSASFGNGRSAESSPSNGG